MDPSRTCSRRSVVEIEPWGLAPNESKHPPSIRHHHRKELLEIAGRKNVVPQLFRRKPQNEWRATSAPLCHPLVVCRLNICFAAVTNETLITSESRILGPQASVLFGRHARALWLPAVRWRRWRGYGPSLGGRHVPLILGSSRLQAQRIGRRRLARELEGRRLRRKEQLKSFCHLKKKKTSAGHADRSGDTQLLHAAIDDNSSLVSGVIIASEIPSNRQHKMIPPLARSKKNSGRSPAASAST